MEAKVSRNLSEVRLAADSGVLTDGDDGFVFSSRGDSQSEMRERERSRKYFGPNNGGARAQWHRYICRVSSVTH